ncbi:MAG: hypothetical protein P8Y67_08535 [Alphaproteobacteria bacterium]
MRNSVNLKGITALQFSIFTGHVPIACSALRKPIALAIKPTAITIVAMAQLTSHAAMNPPIASTTPPANNHAAQSGINFASFSRCIDDYPVSLFLLGIYRLYYGKVIGMISGFSKAS